MELIINNNNKSVIEPPFELPYFTDEESLSTSKAFIESNTIESSLLEIKENHIIPTFAKDNEPLISHADFIEAVYQKAQELYEGQTVLKPNIRLSHSISGRIPSAKNKPAKDLMDHEKTLYYARMMFVIEIPTISGNIDGNELTLVIGGVKNYSDDNLYASSGTEQHFKLFIGFKNLVCTNMCVSSDGLLGSIAVKNLDQLRMYTRMLLESFNHNYLLNSLSSFNNYSLTEQQFANLVGRCRMYNHLPRKTQQQIPPMQFGENQLGLVVKEFYNNDNFSRNADGSISLWKLYNLFTSANKSSYIDTFPTKAVNAFSFVYAIKMALDDKSENWFLN